MATRKVMGESKSAGGFGESQPFVNPDAETPEIYSCHIDGVTVTELIENGSLLQPPPYGITDEGMKERVEKMMKAGTAATIRTSLVRDAAEKQVDAFGGQLADEVRFAGAVDPFRALMDEHVPAGFSGLMLNDAACNKITTQGYEPVLVNGKRVQLGDAWLGIKPTKAVEAEKKYYHDLFREQEKESSDKAFRDKQRALYADEGAALPDFLKTDRTDSRDPGITDDNLI